MLTRVSPCPIVRCAYAGANLVESNTADVLLTDLALPDGHVSR
jgi:hypothetical protein